MPQQVDFFFDFVSPYTYLAQTQLPALKERTGASFRLWPMRLLNLMKQVGNVPTTKLAGERGVFGSPTFIVGEDAFFGNDRLEFLEERLRSNR